MPINALFLKSKYLPQEHLSGEDDDGSMQNMKNKAFLKWKFKNINFTGCPMFPSSGPGQDGKQNIQGKVAEGCPKTENEGWSLTWQFAQKFIYLLKCPLLPPRTSLREIALSVYREHSLPRVVPHGITAIFLRPVMGERTPRW